MGRHASDISQGSDGSSADSQTALRGRTDFFSQSVTDAAASLLPFPLPPPPPSPPAAAFPVTSLAILSFTAFPETSNYKPR